MNKPTGAEGLVEQPSEPGGFIGDIFFGDPEFTTRGTHRWAGTEWVALPDETETLMLLLAEARATIAALREEVAALRHDLERCMAREFALLNPTEPSDGR